MKKLFIFIVIFLCLGSFSFAKKTQILKEPEVEILKNGLKVAWFEDPTLPVIDYVLLFKRGHRNDPKGQSGLAQLTGQLLDRGADGLSALELAEQIEQLGGSFSVSVDQDVTTASMHGLTQDAMPLLSLFLRIVQKPTFSQIEIERERGRILERWFRGVEYSEVLASLGFLRVVSSNTEEARGAMAESSELKSIHQKDVMNFYANHYSLSDATLMIVGRVNKEKLREQLLTQITVKSKPQKDSSRVVWSDPKLPSLKNEVLVVHRPGLTQAQIRYGFMGVPAQHPDRSELSVVNALFGEFFESRLNRVIRDQLGLTYGISSAFGFGKHFGTFSISASTRNEYVGRVIVEIQRLMAELLTDSSITAEELQTSKEYLLGQFPLTVSNPQAIAIRWLTGLAYDLGSNYLNEYYQSIEQVTLEKAQKAVLTHMKNKTPVIVVSGDAKHLEGILKKQGLKFKLMQASDLLR